MAMRCGPLACDCMSFFSFFFFHFFFWFVSEKITMRITFNAFVMQCVGVVDWSMASRYKLGCRMHPDYVFNCKILKSKNESSDFDVWCMELPFEWNLPHLRAIADIYFRNTQVPTFCQPCRLVRHDIIWANYMGKMRDCSDCDLWAAGSWAISCIRRRYTHTSYVHRAVTNHFAFVLFQ